MQLSLSCTVQGACGCMQATFLGVLRRTTTLGKHNHIEELNCSSNSAIGAKPMNFLITIYVYCQENAKKIH